MTKVKARLSIKDVPTDAKVTEGSARETQENIKETEENKDQEAKDKPAIPEDKDKQTTAKKNVHFEEGDGDKADKVAEKQVENKDKDVIESDVAKVPEKSATTENVPTEVEKKADLAKEGDNKPVEIPTPVNDKKADENVKDKVEEKDASSPSKNAAMPAEGNSPPTKQ